jgi:hypothetical protein
LFYSIIWHHFVFEVHVNEISVFLLKCKYNDTNWTNIWRILFFSLTIRKVIQIRLQLKHTIVCHVNTPVVNICEKNYILLKYLCSYKISRTGGRFNWIMHVYLCDGGNNRLSFLEWTTKDNTFSLNLCHWKPTLGRDTTIKSKYIFQISTIKKNNENKNRNNNITVQHVGISVLIQ